MINVGNHLFTDHHLINMRRFIKMMIIPMVQTKEFILEGNIMNVLTVGKPSSGKHSLLNTREFTLGKNPLSVMYVEKPSGTAHP